MFNKMNIPTSVKEFKNDSWFQPMLHFTKHDIKYLTIDLVEEYLNSQGLTYNLKEYNSCDENFDFEISSTNEFDLSCIFKRGDGHFHTQHVHNDVSSVSYLGEMEGFPNDSIFINIHHNDGWLVSDDTWKHWLACRFDISEEDIQENRNTKLNTLLDKESDERMATDFNQHLIRHIKYFIKNDSDRFISSVYDFYKKRGFMTKNQLASVKKVMYYNKGYNY